MVRGRVDKIAAEPDPLDQSKQTVGTDSFRNGQMSHETSRFSRAALAIFVGVKAILRQGPAKCQHFTGHRIELCSLVGIDVPSPGWQGLRKAGTIPDIMFANNTDGGIDTAIIRWDDQCCSCLAGKGMRFNPVFGKGLGSLAPSCSHDKIQQPQRATGSRSQA